MANTGFRGVDVRQSTSKLVFRASLKDAAGAKLTTGTTTLALYEVQDDGTLKSYDFNDNTFKTTALTTATAAMTHRQGNNATVDTGLWTAVLATLSGFTVGAIYIAVVINTGAVPPQQEREFQFGGAQSDDVSQAEALTELAAVPAATAGWLAMLKWVFLRARNKQTLATDGTKTVYADNSSTPVGTGTDADDGTTFTSGKLS